MVKYTNTFSRIDGVDLAPTNLENAKKWIQHNNFNPDNYTLYLCNGVDLSSIPSDTYDIVMSTICLQHICVYDIRFNYLKEFYRILKNGGYIAIQMGYGENSPLTVDYYANHYNAQSTNRGCDTSITNPNQVGDDLKKIGFTDFKYYIGPKGPGDCHPNWIYINAKK